MDLYVREEHIRKAIETYDPSQQGKPAGDICTSCVLYFAARERLAYLKRSLKVGLNYITLHRNDGRTRYFKLDAQGKKITHMHYPAWETLIAEAPITVTLEEETD